MTPPIVVSCDKLCVHAKTKVFRVHFDRQNSNFNFFYHITRIYVCNNGIVHVCCEFGILRIKQFLFIKTVSVAVSFSTSTRGFFEVRNQTAKYLRLYLLYTNSDTHPLQIVKMIFMLLKLVA